LFLLKIVQQNERGKGKFMEKGIFDVTRIGGTLILACACYFVRR